MFFQDVVPDKVNNVSDDACIVVEFCNEDNSVAAGFANWLKDDYEPSELNECVESNRIVEVYWPKIDFKACNNIRKKIKQLFKDQWKLHAVKVLGVGDWASSVKMVNLIQKTNVPFTTRGNRHRYMKKKDSSSDEEELTVEKAVQHEKQKARSDKKKHKVLATARKEANVEELQKFITQRKTDWTKRLLDEESDDDIISDRNVVKDELRAKVQLLEQQNKDLRVELSHYKGIVLGEKKADKLNSLLESAERMLRKQFCPRCEKRKMNTTDIDNQARKKFRTDDSVVCTQSGFDKSETESALLKVIPLDMAMQLQKNRNVSFSSTPSPGTSAGQLTTSTTTEPAGSAEMTLQKYYPQTAPSGNPSTENGAAQRTTPSMMTADVMVQDGGVIADQIEENMMDLGFGVKVPQLNYDKVRKGPLRSFLIDMSDTLFDENEFRTGSLSGKKGTTKLDENKLKAIKESAKKVFPQETENVIQSTLDKMIIDKCKNAKRVKIIRQQEQN